MEPLPNSKDSDIKTKRDYCQKICHELQGQTECDPECEFRCPPLWDDNLDAWDLWMAIRTQWRVGIVGAAGLVGPQPIGLDYGAVYAVARTMMTEITPAVLRKLQALEIFEVNRKPGEGDDNGSQ